MFLFNETSINEVYFIGLQDVEEFRFRKYLDRTFEYNHDVNQ